MQIDRAQAFGMALLLVLLICVFTAHASGQSALAEVSGSVHDEEHGVVPSAVITIRNVETGLTRGTVSDRSGIFHLPGLAPGRYELSVKLPGFTTFARSIDLTIGERKELIATLPVAGIAIPVDVKVTAPNSRLSLDTPSRTFTTKQIDEFPLQNRSFANLALLTPGILTNQVATGSSTGIAAAAQTGKNNLFLLDGLTLDDTTIGATRGSLSPDAIREFVVLANNFDAEFGQASGAVVAIVTRSGTNDRDGRAYYFHRDNRWDAPSFAASLTSPPLPDSTFEQKIAGGFVGGPIARNRAFYFSSIDHTMLDSEAIVTSPALQTFRPDAVNHIPVTQRTPKLMGRIDVAQKPSSMLTLRYRLHQSTNTNSFGASDVGSAAPERAFNATTRYQDLAFLHNATQGASHVNEFRFQVTRGGFDRTDPNCLGCTQEDRATIKLGKLSTVPSGVTEDRLEFADTFTSLISSSHGDHAIKTGADISFVGVEVRGLANADGTYRFQTDEPLDPPSQYSQSFGAQRIHLDHRLYAVFIQDSWNPRENITVNLGLRWDYDDGPGVSSDGRDLAPRLSVVWVPGHSGRTSIRGGYGRYFDQVPLSIAAAAEQTSHSSVVQHPTYPNKPADVGLWSVSRVVNLRVPYNDELTVGTQHAVSHGLTLSADVVAARGHDLLVTHDLNYPDPVTHVRPNIDVQRITAVESRGNSWYRALDVGAERPHSRGYSYTVAYTWSKAERDTEDAAFIPQDQNNFAAERGPAASDVRHRFAAAVNLDLPVGLRFTAVATAQSALPYNVTSGTDDNHDGYPGDRPAGTGRNSARGADFRQLDARISKMFRVHGSEVEALLEAFNVTNRANWSGYEGNRKAGSSFGTPTDALPARQIQAGIRLNF